jgi:hypothetical protein
VNREEYLQAEFNRIMDVPAGFKTPILVTREEYISRQLTRINSEVPPCPGGKYSLMYAMPCDLCGIDTPRYTS